MSMPMVYAVIAGLGVVALFSIGSALKEIAQALRHDDRPEPPREEG